VPKPQPSHLEVERTFTAERSTQLPDLLGGQVTELREVHDITLEATYHDTEDLRLLGAGITLRRREGGDDEGWHAKVAVGSSRLELHRPLTKAAAPPVAMRRLLRGVVRDAALVPVSHVRTRRSRLHLLGSDGTVLAELARDQVTSQRLLGQLDPALEGAPDGAMHWDELEVELVDGDLDVLENLTHVFAEHGIVESDSPSKLRRSLGDLAPAIAATPSKRSTAGEVVSVYLSQQWGRVLRHDVRLRAGQPDAVHRMRTSARRLRSALASYRALLDADRTREVESQLRRLGQELSAARDLQVADRLLADTLAADEPAADSEAAARVTRRLMATRRRSAAGHVEAYLGSDDYLRLLDDVGSFVAAPAFSDRARRPAGREVRKQVMKAHRKVVRRWDVAASHDLDERAEALHATRKATKRLRYACEVALPTLGKPAGRMRRRAKELSGLLGERQDAVVLKQRIVELLPQATKGRAGSRVAFALGRLHARMDARIVDLDMRAARASRRVRARKVVSGLA